ncbi:MAG: hypothetical protein FJY07_05855 [Bacteroidetes bacterium]|nr:hypothetical protein [Bacteroidota bacterium]
MVQIEFTPRQAEELKNHYMLELEKLQHRSAEIMGILSKLVHEPTGEEKPMEPTPVKSFVTTKEIKPVEQTLSLIKRRGRPTTNPDWSNYIPQLLREHDKPMTKEQILKSYQKQYNVDLSNSNSAKLSLNQSIQRLRVRHNIITSTPRKGKKGNLFSLVKPGEVQIPKIKPAKVAPAEVTVAEDTAKKIPSAPKYSWSQFVTETLTKNKRILSLKDFVNHALVHFPEQLDDKKTTYGKISPILTQMSKSKDKIKTVRKPGISRKFYGLTEWFNGKGELITTFK